MFCKKCKNKKAEELLYEVVYSGVFKKSVDELGNEDVDFGSYNMADDFIDNMLVEGSKKKLIGCNKCLK